MAEDDKEAALKEAVARAAQAREILEHPTVKDALEQLRRSRLEVMMKTKPGPKGDEDRQELHRMLQTIDHFEQIFKRFIRDGHLAEQTLFERMRSKIRRVS